jgi:hypothetical protein
MKIYDCIELVKQNNRIGQNYFFCYECHMIWFLICLFCLWISFFCIYFIGFINTQPLHIARELTQISLGKAIGDA